MNTVLEVANVEKYYGNKGNLTKALDKISFQVERKSSQPFQKRGTGLYFSGF